MSETNVQSTGFGILDVLAACVADGKDMTPMLEAVGLDEEWLLRNTNRLVDEKPGTPS